MADLQTLLTNLNDLDINTRKSAIAALETGVYPDAVIHLIPLLHDRDLRKRTIQALGRLKDPRAIAPLVAMLGNDGHHDRLFKTLTAFGKAAVPALIDVMKNTENEAVRSQVLQLLSASIERKSSRTDEAVEVILDYLISRRNEIQMTTKEKQMEIFMQNPGAPPPIVPIYLVHSLASTGDPHMIEPLLSLTAEGSIYNPIIAMALVNFNDERIIAFMTTLLRDEHPQTRQLGYQYLQRHASPEQKALLQETLKDDWMVNSLNAVQTMDFGQLASVMTNLPPDVKDALDGNPILEVIDKMKNVFGRKKP